MSPTRPRGLAPHIFVRGADAAAAYYCRVFEAEELVRQTLPDGHILFIELALGPARLLLSEDTPSLKAHAPSSVDGAPMLLLLEVDDVDAVAQRAIDAGAQVEMPVREMFWGERYCVLQDPFGWRWAISTAREELSPDEVARRMPPDATERP